MDTIPSISKQVIRVLFLALIVMLLLMNYGCGTVRSYTVTDVNNNGHVRLNGSKHWFVVSDSSRLMAGDMIVVKRNSSEMPTLKRIN